MIRLNLHINKEDLFLFLLMIVFILFTYILADFIVMKDLDRYVELKNRYRFQQTLEKYIFQNREDLTRKYENLKGVEKYLIHFEKGVDLKNFVANYGKVERFEKSGEEMVDRHIMQKGYMVTALFDTPKKYFQMLNDLRSKGLPAKIGYPVEFKKEGEKIRYSSLIFLYSFVERK